MKKLIYVFSFFVGAALLFYPSATISLSFGSPGGKTGSPSDNSDCTSCHSVLSTTSALTNITSNIPPTGYVPGTTYTITASLNLNSLKNGFEVTCEEDATGSKAGTFFITNTNTTKLVNSGSSVTHKPNGNALSTWVFDWEAPAQGTGPITFYGAFIEAGYPWASNIGDYFSSYSLSVQEHVPMLQTYIPDDSFELFLESNGMGNGILNDDSVTTSNINMVKQLYVNNLNIYDLTGIEDFDSLETLNCNFNPGLLNLDLSNNTALLSVSANQIWGTQPGSLANINVSNCTSLQFLTCLHTQVTSIDVANCPDLIDLNVGHNLIDSINISNNTLLETIIVDNNLISSIDLTNNTNITHLDISDNPNLQCVDLRNGQNININGFYSTGNPNLHCIKVDDSLYSTNNWTNISLQNYFSNNCPPNCVNNNFNCIDSLQVTDVTITPSTSTITIGIYNGYNSFLSYPHVTYTIDANGDTLHTGQLNLFGAFGLDTSWYSYQLSGTSPPTMPLGIYFVYTVGSFVSDTCLLTFNNFTTNIIGQNPNQTKEILKITDLLGRQTQPIKNTPLIYIYKNGTKEKRIILD